MLHKNTAEKFSFDDCKEMFLMWFFKTVREIYSHIFLKADFEYRGKRRRRGGWSSGKRRQQKQLQ